MHLLAWFVVRLNLLYFAIMMISPATARNNSDAHDIYPVGLITDHIRTTVTTSSKNR